MSKAIAGLLVLVLGVPAIVAVGMCASAAVAMCVWNWCVSPLFHAPNLTLLQAMAAGLALSAFHPAPLTGKQKQTEEEHPYLVSLARMGMLIAVAYALSRFV